MRGLFQRIADAMPVPRPTTCKIVLPEEDDFDSRCPVKPDTETAGHEAITGSQIVIEYRDGKGQQSTRRITCRRIETRGGVRYLSAFCLERNALRAFRADRIVAIIDPATGEVHSPGTVWLLRFSDDETSASGWRFGLSPQQFSHLTAGLNVLTFLARCDGNWHELEREAVEQFAAIWWMRAEVRAEFDIDAIGRHATRLGPDPETFALAVEHCGADPVLRRIIAQHAAAVIDADGRHHPKELYWGQVIVDHLASQ